MPNRGERGPQAEASRLAQSFAGPETQTGSRRAAAVVCGLLVLAVVAIYGQTLRYDFINYDDNEYVYENPHVLAGLSREGVVWAFTNRVSAQWTPLTLLSLMADAQLLLRHGTRPPDLARLAAGMHAVNVALHAANVVLLFLVLRAMTGRLWPSALAAAVFAVHPLHVESVAWITERKDVLSGLFGLLALAAYAWYAKWKKGTVPICRNGPEGASHKWGLSPFSPPSVVRYLSVAAALTLGLLAKPMLVTWPLVFLLLDYWPLRRKFTAGVLLEKVPLLLLVVAFSIVAFRGQQSGEAVFSLETVPLSQRIAFAADLYVVYLGKSFWPMNLAAVYAELPMVSNVLALAAAALLVLITGAALWGARHGQRWLAVGWLWYLITLAPVIGLVRVGSVVMADRFVYLPQIGLCLALVWAADRAAVTSLNLRRTFAVAALLVVIALAACARRQVSYWEDSITLWTHTLACTSGTWAVHNNLGIALDGRGRHKEAIEHFQKGVEIRPGFALSHSNLGLALAHDGQFEKAADEYREALRLDPDSANAQNGLGVILVHRGEYDEAIRHFDRALGIQPDFAEARRNRDMALGKKAWGSGP